MLLLAGLLGIVFVISLLNIDQLQYGRIAVRRLTVTDTFYNQYFDPKTVEPKNYYKDTVTQIMGENTFSKSKLPFPLHFSTYSNDRMNITRDRLLHQAQRSGWFKSAYAFSPSDLPQEFTEEFKDILNLRRGAGYWIWRFPILEMMMDRIPEGDFFVFLDAGCWINPYAEPKLLNWLHQLNSSDYDEIGFKMPYIEHRFTTDHLFNAFGISNDSPLRTDGQMYGGILIMRKGPHLRLILRSIYEVLRKDPYLITDEYNKEAKIRDIEFDENRHDQSVHSLARKVHGSVEIRYREVVVGDSPFPNDKLRIMTQEQVEEMEQALQKDPSLINDSSWRKTWKYKVHPAAAYAAMLRSRKRSQSS